MNDLLNQASREASRATTRRARRATALRWGAYLVGGALATVVGAATILIAFGPSLDLSFLRGQLEATASGALDRRVTFDGPIRLIPSLRPTVQIEGLHIANPEAWPERDFARLDLARVQLAVLPLLRGDLLVEELAIDGLAIHLRTNASGKTNWQLGGAAPSGKQQDQADREFELQALALSDVRLIYDDAESQVSHTVVLDRVAGEAQRGRPMTLTFEGSINEVSYKASVTAGDLATLTGGEHPWPVDLSASALGVDVTLTGSVADPLRGQGLDFDVGLKVTDINELEKLLGRTLPLARGFDLSGYLRGDDGIFALTEVQSKIGGTPVFGNLMIDVSGPRPRFEGAVEVPEIDAGPFFAALDRQASAEGGATERSVHEPIDLDAKIESLDLLEAFDADLRLSIQQVVNSPITARAASLRVTVADGALSSPLSATVAEVPFAGEINLASDEADLLASISLTADRSRLGDLLAVLTRAKGIEGSFQSAGLELSARGATLRSLIETSAFRFAIVEGALSYGHGPGEEPVHFTLEHLDLSIPAGGQLQASATGTWLDEPYSLDLRGGNFIEYSFGHDWPITVSAAGGGAVLELAGNIGEDRPGSVSEFTFSFTGDKIGGLAKWTGVAPEATAPYTLSGTARIGDSARILQFDEARIGTSSFEGQVGLETADARTVTIIKLAFATIDVERLAALRPDRPLDKEDAVDSVFSIDLPILSKGVELVDSDIAISVERLMMAQGDVTDIAISARTRQGHLTDAPLQAVIAGALVQGHVSADLRGETPRVDLALGSKDMDLGDLLARFGIVDGLSFTARRLELDLGLRGVSLRAMLENSSLSARMEESLLHLQDPNTGRRIEIAIPAGTIEARADSPITLGLDGTLDGTPVKIAVQTDSLASFVGTKTSLNAQVSIDMLGTELELTGSAPLPLQPQNTRFTLDLSNPRLSDVNEVFDVSLPPWGPISIAGAFGSRESGYFIEDLRLKVGSSRLTGNAALDTTSTPPKLDLELNAATVQLDDFAVSDWSAKDAPHETADPDASHPADANLHVLLSPEVMHSLDADIAVRVDQVQSGPDRLGSGTLVASIRDGRLVVAPLAVSLPGGNVDVAFAIRPTEEAVELEASGKINQLDYGVLARRIDSQSTTSGRLSLDLNLNARGADLSDVMARSNGYIAFGVWPDDLEAGVFDLWAVNIFTAVLPSLDSEASHVNCAVAHLAIDDGIMRPTTLLIDTSRMQVSGDGTIDFNSDQIDLRAAPRPKRAQMFSAQTPVRVQGSFSDFELGVSSGALTGTVVRMITSPVTTPFKWIFAESEHPDGRVACQSAWDSASSRGHNSAP